MADTDVLPKEDGHIDAGMRMLSIQPGVFNGLSDALGLPATGGTMMMVGGGATIAPGKLRVQASAWTGALSASQGSKSTRWGLDLGCLSLEERYPYDTVLLTAGTTLDFGRLSGALDDYSSASLNRVEAEVWGSSVSAGIRWPAQTKVGFFVRTAWQWLQGDGVWHGPQAASLGSTHFDLSGPSVTAQIEMSL